MRKSTKKSGVGAKRGNPRKMQRAKWLPGFTLIELLTVMAIIVVLAGLVLMGAGWAQKKAGSSRAEAEIKAMSIACESYKTDQGIYPLPKTQLIGSGSSNVTPTTYATASTAPRALYQALSGDGNDALYSTGSSSVASSGTVLPGQTQYMEFKPKMLAGLDSTQKPTALVYVQDPFGYAYGYYTPNLTGTTATSGTEVVYNPTFDLWSTAGVVTTPGAANTGTPPQERWIKNW